MEFLFKKLNKKYTISEVNTLKKDLIAFDNIFKKIINSNNFGISNGNNLSITEYNGVKIPDVIDISFKLPNDYSKITELKKFFLDREFIDNTDIINSYINNNVLDIDEMFKELDKYIKLLSTVQLQKWALNKNLNADISIKNISKIKKIYRDWDIDQLEQSIQEIKEILNS